MGKPGKPPTWGPGAKSGVGTAIGPASCVWFTMAQGCITETFYPRPDLAQTRCVFLVVTDGAGFFSDERLDASHTVRIPERAVPLFEVENLCRRNRYRISKTILTDPSRHALLQRVRFERISQADRLRLWILLLPAIDNEAYGNAGTVDPRRNMLIAARGNFALAMTASCGFSRSGCYYQGPNDLWNRLKAGEAIDHLVNQVNDGNVLVAGEIDCGKSAQGDERFQEPLNNWI